MIYVSVDLVFFFKQKTAYEMRISDWSSDVCSSDLDKGYGLSAELAWAGAKPWPAGLKGSELYVFADGGEVWTASRFFGLLPRQNYEMASAGGGVRLNFTGKTLVGLEGIGRESWRVRVCQDG